MKATKRRTCGTAALSYSSPRDHDHADEHLQQDRAFGEDRRDPYVTAAGTGASARDDADDPAIALATIAM